MNSLPIDSLLPEIVAGVKKHSNSILTATPGAGKTTRLPPELLKIFDGVEHQITGQKTQQKIVVLQPRRMAAVSACYRVAEERGWTVGEEVGYQVRFESKVSKNTRLIFMTDALLLRKMVDDPELNDIGLVVLDEFHERTLNQDLLLGALRELQELGRDIKILVMSATLDVGALKKYLAVNDQSNQSDQAVLHIDVPGKVFPLEIRHSQQALSLKTDYAFYDRVTLAVQQAVKETKGDVLVFLPGVGEIKRLEERLEKSFSSAGIAASRDIVSLHGSLSLSEQRKILTKPERPRVILSTNVAEASVTVQGVNYVIDTGLSKVMTVNPHSGFSALDLGRISKFNAKQRSGRAAREQAGTALRLWTTHEEHTQAEQLEPEVQRADLTSALLWLSHMGVRDFAKFSWLDRPQPPALNIALQSLQSMGALTKDNAITERGRRLMRFPLPPRLGLILLEAEEMGECRLGARVAALLSERDFASREISTGSECDVTDRLQLLEEKARGTETIRQTAEQLERLMKGEKGSSQDPQDLLLLSQRDRLCRRREKSARGLMVGGRGVKLDPKSQIHKSEFFLALAGVDLADQAETLVSIASGFDKAQILKTFANDIQTEESIHFVEDKEAFYLSRVRTLYGLPLEDASLKPVNASDVQDKLAEVLLPKWDWLVSKNEALKNWMFRWNFLCHHLPEYKESLGESQIAQALSMACYGKSSVKAVLEDNLVGFLEMNIDANAVKVLNNQVPEKFLAPSGVKHSIEYSDIPYVDIRLQEIFGLLESPKVLFDKIPITFRLLGPNFRPVQITADLKNFWKQGYAEVRKELRIRYPKHSWPEDPYMAVPEAKGRRRF